MEKRYIGIDLHRNRFTCCIRLENDRTYMTEWKLEELAQFVKKLRPSDEVAVEITGNTRLFHDAVASQVARLVVVDSNQFRVISRSVKKTDPHDARLLSLYLSKNLLPEVRMKDKKYAQVASLTQTRDTLVKQRSALKNKINNILSARAESAQGSAIEREATERSGFVTFRGTGADRTAGDRGSDSRSEQAHRTTGKSDCRRQFGTGRPHQPNQH
jgi:hypothetical protein